jgi:hypothetical protein
MASAGLGPLAILKSESAQVAVGTLGICIAGILVGQAWFMSSACLPAPNAPHPAQPTTFHTSAATASDASPTPGAGPY